MSNPPKESQGYQVLDNKELENEDRWYVPAEDSLLGHEETMKAWEEYLHNLTPKGWKAAEITLSRVNKWEDLNKPTAEASDEKFIELSRKLWARDIATHWKKEGVKFSDLDGQASVFLLKVAGIKPKEIDYLAHGQFAEGRINIDTGDTDGIQTNFGEQRYDDPAQQAKYEKTAFIDHHGQSRANDTSATKYTYEVLTSLGMLEKTEVLDKFIDFVTRCDNKDLPKEYYSEYDQSHRTLYGLAGFIRSPETLFQFFKDGKDPVKPMTDEELRTYDFIRRGTLYDKDNKPILNADGTQKLGWVNYSEVRGERIKEARDVIAVLKSHGFSFESDGFGKTIINFGAMRVDVDTVIAEGFDTSLLWNPGQNGFAISAMEGIPEDFLLSQGRRVRKTHWIKPINTELTISLDQILKKMAGDNFEAQGDLKSYIETGRLTPELQKLMKGIETEEEIPPVVEPEPEEPDTRDFLDANFESEGKIGKNRDEFIQSAKAIMDGTLDRRLVWEDKCGKFWQFKKLVAREQNPILTFVRFYGSDGHTDESQSATYDWLDLLRSDNTWYSEKGETSEPVPPVLPAEQVKKPEVVGLSEEWEKRGNTASSFDKFMAEVRARMKYDPNVSPLIVKDHSNKFWYFEAIKASESDGTPMRFVQFDPVAESIIQPRVEKNRMDSLLKRMGFAWYTRKTVEPPAAPEPIEPPPENSLPQVEPPEVKPEEEEAEVFGPPELYGPPEPPPVVEETVPTSEEAPISEAVPVEEVAVPEVTQQLATAERADVEEAETSEFIISQEDIIASLQPGFRWKLNPAMESSGEIEIKGDEDPDFVIKAANWLSDLKIKLFVPLSPDKITKNDTGAELIVEGNPTIRVKRMKGNKGLEEYLMFFYTLIQNYYPAFPDKRFVGLKEKYNQLARDIENQYVDWFNTIDQAAVETTDKQPVVKNEAVPATQEPGYYIRYENAVRPNGIVLFYQSGPIVIKTGQEWHLNLGADKKVVRIEEVEYGQDVEGTPNINFPNDVIRIKVSIITDGIEAPLEEVLSVADWAKAFKTADEFTQYQKSFKEDVKEIG